MSNFLFNVCCLNHSKRKFFLVLLLCAAMALLSVAIRYPQPDTYNYNNADATFHTLLTIEAYKETPASIHRFLPLVSLGDEMDKNITWGACAPDKLGNYYYTSFSPAGFFAPYLFFEVFHLPVSEQSLYLFNSLLYLCCWLFSAFLFIRLFRGRADAKTILLLVSLAYLFEKEIMHSQGIVYWSHSLFQLFFILQMIAFMDKDKKGYAAMFFALCLLLPYMEWTGFVSNAGFALALLLDKNRKFKKKLVSAVCVGVLTVGALLLFIFHFSMVLDRDQLIRLLISRFFARNVTVKIPFNHLVQGYLLSYGLFILLIFTLLLAVLIHQGARRYLLQLMKEKALFFFVMVFPLLENVIMKEHAISYSFDRLKGIFPLIFLMLALYCACHASFKHAKSAQVLIIVTLSATSFVNLSDYRTPPSKYIWKADYLPGNTAFAKYIGENYNSGNSTMGQSTATRGYANILFSRGIFEGSSISSTKDAALRLNKKYAIQLFQQDMPWNMNVYHRAVVTDTEDNTQEFLQFNPENRTVAVSAGKYIMASTKSDPYWSGGVSLENHAVLYDNTPFNSALLENAQSLRSGDTVAKIAAIQRIDDGIQVLLEEGADSWAFGYVNPVEVLYPPDTE